MTTEPREKRTSTGNALHGYYAMRSSDETTAPTNSGEDTDSKGEQNNEPVATDAEKPQFQNRISTMLKLPPKSQGQAQSPASSIHTRNDASMDRSFQERKSKTQTYREAALRYSESLLGIFYHSQPRESQLSSRPHDPVDAINAVSAAEPQAEQLYTKDKDRTLRRRLSKSLLEVFSPDSAEESNRQGGVTESAYDLSDIPIPERSEARPRSDAPVPMRDRDRHHSHDQPKRQSFIGAWKHRISKHQRKSTAGHPSRLSQHNNEAQQLPELDLGPRDFTLRMQASMVESAAKLPHPDERRFMREVLVGMSGSGIRSLRRRTHPAEALSTKGSMLVLDDGPMIPQLGVAFSSKHVVMSDDTPSMPQSAVASSSKHVGLQADVPLKLQGAAASSSKHTVLPSGAGRTYGSNVTSSSKHVVVTADASSMPQPVVASLNDRGKMTWLQRSDRGNKNYTGKGKGKQSCEEAVPDDRYVSVGVQTENVVEENNAEDDEVYHEDEGIDVARDEESIDQTLKEASWLSKML